MATNINTILNWFMTGKKPTQAQFWASWSSFWHKDEAIPQSSISGLENVLNAKTENDQFNAHKTDANAHIDLFAGKEDKTQKGVAGGYVPLNGAIKIASQYLNIVNDLVTGGSSAIASAETVKTLKTQIDSINTLLTSNDVNLDTVQELVNAIKTVQTSLSTILVNDLTTGGTTKAATAETVKTLKGLFDALSTNKVDKAAGERLINAAEITKLAGLGSLTTTVKSILSTALASQDVAGMVAYINAVTPVLVVGGNETVKYKTTDTGRVFELLLRGRSFGVGQAAIVAADVIEITEFLNKDIKFSNYPSTRNDGQLPTNKVLAPDVNGNLKLYTIATAPAPYLDELIPDSYLPSTTGNFILKGSFFTPTMTVTIVGQTINYMTFISDNEVRVNVTTGAADGSFAVTLDNGISRTFNNALLIVLGTVYKPTNADWTVVEPTTINNDEIFTKTGWSVGNAKWPRASNKLKNYSFYYSMSLSPLILASSIGAGTYNFAVEFVDVVNADVYKIGLWWFGYGNCRILYAKNASVVNDNIAFVSMDAHNIRMYFNAGRMYLHLNGTLIYTFGVSDFQNNVNIRFITGQFDYTSIKYVEHN